MALPIQTALPDLLRPAATHAALGDELPRLRRVPAPVRWAGRAAAGVVYAAARVLTKRQKAYNLSMLDAVADLAGRVQALEVAPPPAPALPGVPAEGPRSFASVYNTSSWMEY